MCVYTVYGFHVVTVRVGHENSFGEFRRGKQQRQRPQQCVTDIGDPPKRRLTLGFLLAYTWHSLIKQANVANIENKPHQYRAPVDTAWSPRGLGY